MQGLISRRPGPLLPVVVTCGRTASTRADLLKLPIPMLTTFAGLLLGMFVTISSVGAGAGAIGMTALVLLYPRTPIARRIDLTGRLEIPERLAAEGRSDQQDFAQGRHRSLVCSRVSRTSLATVCKKRQPAFYASPSAGRAAAPQCRVSCRPWQIRRCDGLVQTPAGPGFGESHGIAHRLLVGYRRAW